MKTLALLGLVLLSGCPAEKKPEPPPPTPEQQFWTSFAFDEASLAELARGKNAAAAMLQISRSAEKVHKGLIAEISVEPDATKPHTLVFTANGDRTLFPLVKSLVAAAPPMKHWKVVAFRQRNPALNEFKLGDFAVIPSDYSFKETGREKGLLDIEIRVKGMTDANQRLVDQAAFLILDHTLGEYDVETKLGAIDIKPAPVAADPAFQPLTDIAKVTDAMPAR